MLVDIHILQNHAPSNLNRDDTGAPKDAVFGGYPRARISSQCLKRTVRRSEVFRDAFAGDGLLAQRTRLFPRLLRVRLEAMGLPESTVAAITRRATEFGRESGRTAAAGPGEAAEGEAAVEYVDNQTAQLIFLTDAEIDTLATKLAALYEQMGDRAFQKAKVDEITKALGSSAPRSVDIAMFGRMTTSAAFENVMAAVQVAHAISTHRVDQQFDYYTAVDDVSGEAGAGFIGDTAFNSATYYKYLSVHWEALASALEVPTARRAVSALIEAAALVQPTGKQNVFAAHNLPDVVLVEVRRRNLPVSYANAFLQPVRAAGASSLMDASVRALAEYMGSTACTFGLEAERGFVATKNTYALPDATRLASLDALLSWVPVGEVPAA